MADLGASVLARLKNKAKESGRSYQAKRETTYELHNEESFAPERIAKLIKVSVDTVKQWFEERTLLLNK